MVHLPSPPLWALRLKAAPHEIDALADVVGEGALALTVMAPPRQKLAEAEAIFDAPPDMAAINAQLAVYAAVAGIKAAAPTLHEIPRLDWLKKVAGDFPPLPIKRWTVYGAHHRAAVAGKRLGLQIDATSAFGTGEHPTTRGCLILLDQLLKRHKKPRKMLDMGCGTAVLAMAFAKVARGAAPRVSAVGVDMDGPSITIARHNARVNGVARKLRLQRGLGYRPRVVKQGAPYDLIMANIFARPLMMMAKDAKRHLKPGGRMIVAGLLNHQANGVIRAHAMQRIYLTKRIVIGEWTILAFQRPKRA